MSRLDDALERAKAALRDSYGDVVGFDMVAELVAAVEADRSPKRYWEIRDDGSNQAWLVDTHHTRVPVRVACGGLVILNPYEWDYGIHELADAVTELRDRYEQVVGLPVGSDE